MSAFSGTRLALLFVSLAACAVAGCGDFPTSNYPPVEVRTTWKLASLHTDKETHGSLKADYVLFIGHADAQSGSSVVCTGWQRNDDGSLSPFKVAHEPSLKIFEDQEPGNGTISKVEVHYATIGDRNKPALEIRETRWEFHVPKGSVKKSIELQ